MDQKIFATKHTSCLIKNIYFIKCTRWQRNGVIKATGWPPNLSPLPTFLTRRPRDYERAVSCHDDWSCHYCHYLGSVIRSHPRDHNTAPSGVYSVFTLQQEALPGPAAVYIITYLQCLLSFLASVCLFEWPASSPQQKSIQTSAYKLCWASLRLETSGWRN